MYVEDSPSIVGLAFELMAMAHHRDVVLQAVLLKWRLRTEAVQRRRSRQELIAAFFFNNRLQFTLFRAWQWELAERRRMRLIEHRVCEFANAWRYKRWWRMWRRSCRESQARRHHGEILAVWHGIKLMSCTPPLLEYNNNAPYSRRGVLLPAADDGRNDDSSVVVRPRTAHAQRRARMPWWGCCCRWHGWMRRAGLSIRLRQLVRSTKHEALKTTFRAWCHVFLYTQRPKRLVATHFAQRCEEEQRRLLYLVWLRTTISNKLRRWNRAFLVLKDHVLMEASCALQRRYWTFWRRVATAQLVTHRMDGSRARTAFRCWLKNLVQRRYERHTEMVADAFLQRGHLARWRNYRKLREAQAEMNHAADVFFSERISPFILRRVVERWHRRCAARKRRAQQLADVALVRHGMLIGVALRRLADVAGDGSASPHQPTGVGAGAAISSSRWEVHRAAEAPLSLGVEKVEHTTPSSFADVMTQRMHLKPIPLSAAMRHGASPQPSYRYTPLDRVVLPYPLAASEESPTPPSLAHPHRIPAPIPSDDPRAMQIMHLLERFHDMQRTAKADKAAFCACKEQQEQCLAQLAAAQRGAAGINCPTLGTDCSRRRGDDTTSVMALRAKLLDIEVQLRFLRQRIETRCSLRAQIVLLQRTLKRQIDEAANVVGVAHYSSGHPPVASAAPLSPPPPAADHRRGVVPPLPMQWLDTPRSDVSYR